MLFSPYKCPAVFVLTVIIATLFVYGLLTMRDTRSAAEKIGDAIHELPQGIDKSGRQLEDRTLGQKIGDDVQDAGDKIKKNTKSIYGQ